MGIADDASCAENDDWARGFGEWGRGCFDGLPISLFVALHSFLVASALGVSLYN